MLWHGQGQHPVRSPENHRGISDHSPPLACDLDYLPLLVGKVQVDTVADACDPGEDLALRSIKPGATLKHSERITQSLCVWRTAGMEVKPVDKPVLEGLVLDSPCLSMTTDGYQCVGFTIIGMEQFRIRSQPHQQLHLGGFVPSGLLVHWLRCVRRVLRDARRNCPNFGLRQRWA